MIQWVMINSYYCSKFGISKIRVSLKPYIVTIVYWISKLMVSRHFNNRNLQQETSCRIWASELRPIPLTIVKGHWVLSQFGISTIRVSFNFILWLGYQLNFKTCGIATFTISTYDKNCAVGNEPVSHGPYLFCKSTLNFIPFGISKTGYHDHWC